jgi:murein DD-endopeptidase MepM/ murein hydrolase activator NlpD
MLRFSGISTIRKKLKNCNLATVIPVVFLFGGIALHTVFASVNTHPDKTRRTAIFGGPATLSEAVLRPGAHIGALESFSPVGEISVATTPEDAVAGFVIDELASIEALGGVLGGGLPGRDGLLVYTVVKGDNLLKIAQKFGISLDTILNANRDTRGKALRIGQELVILPVSGVMYLVREGDTIDAIASRYQVLPADILRGNKEKILSGILPIGEQILISGAKIQSTGYAVDSSLPNLSGYFMPPTTGWNWGQIHENNAVDMANACGTSIFAAAEGLVEKTGSAGLWNGGLGGYVTIEHPNGTETLYAHLSKLTVSVGDYVAQKQEIGLMGNTGNVHGPTGCHLHYEVHGARNPLAK